MTKTPAESGVDEPMRQIMREVCEYLSRNSHEVRGRSVDDLESEVWSYIRESRRQRDAQENAQ